MSSSGTSVRSTVAVVANSSWYLLNFRRSLIENLSHEGFRVVTIAGTDGHSQRLAACVDAHHGIPFNGTGTRALTELRTVAALRRTLDFERADVVLSYTPKGNLYAGLAVLGSPRTLIVNISGLGRGFDTSSAWIRWITRVLYRITFRRSAWTFFQNDEDRNLFLAHGWADAARSSRLPGSGVDLDRFKPPTDKAEPDRRIVFLLVARMLWDKGVGEFVEAARMLRRERNDVRFCLLGALAAPGPMAVARETMEEWVAQGAVEYLGTTDDVRPYLATADAVVLPSFYREGVPRSLLEAAAMARPVITTDSVGCRDTVDDGVTGFLCRPRDVVDLALQMRRLINMTPQDRQAMGARARAKMEHEFDEKIVLGAYTNLLRTWGLRNQSGPRKHEYDPKWNGSSDCQGHPRRASREHE